MDYRLSETQFCPKNQLGFGGHHQGLSHTKTQVRHLQDDRNGHLFGRHVVTTITHVRALAEKGEGEPEPTPMDIY